MSWLNIGVNILPIVNNQNFNLVDFSFVDQPDDFLNLFIKENNQ
jgi:hypothetical protein